MSKKYNPITNMLEGDIKRQTKDDSLEKIIEERFVKRFEAMREENFKIWRSLDKLRYRQEEPELYALISSECNGIDYELKKSISRVRNINLKKE